MGFKAVDYRDVPQEAVAEEGAKGTRIRWLIGKGDGASNFAMRHFEVEPGGHSPYHEHPWEHEVFVLKGRCRVTRGDEEALVGPGGVIFVPGGEEHNFENVGEDNLEFLCVIPIVD